MPNVSPRLPISKRPHQSGVPMTDLLDPKPKSKLDSPRTIVPNTPPAARQHHATLLAIGTASPPTVTQSEATTLAETFTCTSDTQRAWLHRVFSRAGVNHRGTVLKTGA